MKKLKERHTRTKPTLCPHCGAMLDMATSYDGYTPSPGDFTICLVCTKILVFDDEMHLRFPLPAEYAQLDPQDHQKLGVLVHAINTVKAKNPKPPAKDTKQ